jgi:Ca2+/Na+ antiporter
VAVFPEYLFSLLGLMAVFTLFIIFSQTRKRFDRWEALVMLGVYLIFFLSEALIH